jgi:hypothetical protein
VIATPHIAPGQIVRTAPDTAWLGAVEGRVIAVDGDTATVRVYAGLVTGVRRISVKDLQRRDG